MKREIGIALPDRPLPPLAPAQALRYGLLMEQNEKPKPAVPGWFLACIALAGILFAGSFAYDEYRDARAEQRKLDYAEQHEGDCTQYSTYGNTCD